MKPLIVVIADGLDYETGRQCCGYLGALVDCGRSRLHCALSELPSLSRPLYECIFTGRIPVESGGVSNFSSRAAAHASVFHAVHEAGGTSAVAAYHWMSELFVRTPWDPVRDKRLERDNATGSIDHGWFYSRDEMPDSEVFAEAEILRRRYRPDLLVVHTMGIDEAGHQSGRDSNAYRIAARWFDMELARYMPGWLEEGASVIVTADHGMHSDRFHGGTSDVERQVPFWTCGPVFGQAVLNGFAQRLYAGTFLRAMGIESDLDFEPRLFA